MIEPERTSIAERFRFLVTEGNPIGLTVTAPRNLHIESEITSAVQSRLEVAARILKVGLEIDGHCITLVGTK
jgi:hypothetical protein